MKSHRNPFFRHAALTAFGLLCSHVPTSAATVYWDSNAATTGASTAPTGTWGVDAFWSADPNGETATAAWVDGDDAVFSAGTDAASAYTVTLGGAISAVTLAVEEGSPTLSAASATTLTLTGIGTYFTPTLAPSAGATLTVGSNVKLDMTGAAAHYIQGAGTINIDNGGTVSAASTATQIAINGPTVNVNSGGTLSQLSTATGTRFYVGVGGTASKLVVNGGTVTINGADGLFFGNNASSKGTLELRSGTLETKKIQKGSNATAGGDVIFDGGTLKALATSTSFWLAANTVTAKISDGGAVIDSNNFDVTISQIIQEDATSTGGGLTKIGLKTLTTDVNHTFTGKATINGGILSTNKIANAGNASGLGTGGTTPAIDLGGGGTLRYSGGNVSTDRAINLLFGNGTVRSDGSGTLTLAGGITGNSQISLRGAKDITVSGAISIGEANPMVKTDNGTVTLSNASNDFGYLWIAAGTISADSIAANGTASALGKGPTANTASIQLGQSTSNTAGVLSFTGPSGGSSDRTIILKNAATGTTGGVGTIENTIPGQTLSLSGGVTAENAATAALTLQGAGDGVMSGVIGGATGTLSVTKAGTGTWTLSNANLYTGATNVRGGTLIVNGIQSTATGTVTVGGATATIGGTPTLTGVGTIGGALTVAAAGGGAVGTVNPGTVGGLGTLNAGTGATIAGNFACDLDAASSDLLAVTGALDVTGATLVPNPLATPAAATYTLATSTTGVTGTFSGLAEGATVSISGVDYTISYLANNITLTKVAAGSGYDAWKGANVGGQTADLDFDNDGVENGVEWFMGIDTPGFTANPALDASKKVTWLKRSGYTGTYGVDYVIQTSLDLSFWTPVSEGDLNLADSPGSVAYTLTGTGKLFTRIVVTP